MASKVLTPIKKRWKKLLKNDRFVNRVMSAAVLLSCLQAISMALFFIRNLLLARNLDPKDLAIVMLMMATVSIIEVLTDTGVNKFLLQDDDGGTYRTLCTIHSIAALRGAALAVLLLVIAPPWCWILGISHTSSTFGLLGLVPLVRGFGHLESVQNQRDLKFGINSLIEVIGHLVAIITVGVFCLLGSDYWMGLYGILAQTITSTVLSHFFSTRKHRFGWTSTVANRAFAYGFPLVLNGVLLAISMQADRLTIGLSSTLFKNEHLTLDVLGQYGVVAGTVAAFSIGIQRMLNSLILPLLSRDKADFQTFQRKADLIGFALGMIILTLCGVFAFFGNEIIVALYGKTYEPNRFMMAILGGTYALRLSRSHAASIALSIAEGYNLVLGNFVRIVFGLGCLVVAALGGDVIAIAAVCFFSELFASLSASALLWRKNGIKFSVAFRSQAILFSMFSGCALFFVLGSPISILLRLAIFLIAFAVPLIAICRNDDMLRVLRHFFYPNKWF
jgi:O-antigen/teichoic acid export membrane protein